MSVAFLRYVYYYSKDRGRSDMDNNIPPYVDFPEYNEFSQSYLWPVTVKYKGQSEIHFSVPKSDTISAFHTIENGSEEPILIGSLFLKGKI
jgi:hypothetical protein